MKIEERIVTQGHGKLTPSYVVIHETANPGATALNHVSYWKNNPEYAVHYVGDWTGIAYHCVPDDRLCWQVGNGNAKVIGIELCHAKTAADFKKVWALGVEWAAWMLKKKGWGVDQLISHDDCRRMWGGTDHTDPIGYFKKYGRTWDEFKAEVKKALGTTAPTTPAQPAKTGTYKVQVGAYSKKANATTQANKLKKAGFETVIVQDGNLYKVQCGAFSSKANADALLAKLKKAGYTAVIVGGSAAAPATQPVTCPYSEPVGIYVTQGTIGNAAKWVQWQLNRHGAKLTVDGIIGSQSLAAIRTFQRSAGLDVDGVVGPATRAALKK